MGNAAGGLHMAALGGLWQTAVFGFAGLHLTDEGPALAPHLPRGWKQIHLTVEWRGQRFDLSTSEASHEQPDDPGTGR